MLIQAQDVTVPVIPGPDAGRGGTLPPRPPADETRRGRWTGRFLDAVIWFSVFAAANGFALLAAAVFDDVRELAGF